MSNCSVGNIVNAIHESELKGLLVENQGLSGFSGEKLIGLLQRLSSICLTGDECYLEVGVFQGLTLLSVAKATKAGEAYGIDNFAFFDTEGKNFSIVKQRIKNLGIDNATIINMDYEDALEQLGKHIGKKKVGVYFVDGPHDYRSQLMCLELIKPFLSKNAVILVDDSNYRHVRQANRDFLSVNPDFKLIFEAYTESHPGNMSDEQEKEARKGWWNGVNVIVKDVDNQLSHMLPPTLRERTLYENDHIVHAEKGSICAVHAVRAVSSIMSFNLIKFVVDLSRLVVQMSRIQNEFKGEYRSMNTHSRELTKSKFNASVE